MIYLGHFPPHKGMLFQDYDRRIETLHERGRVRRRGALMKMTEGIQIIKCFQRPDYFSHRLNRSLASA